MIREIRYPSQLTAFSDFLRRHQLAVWTMLFVGIACVLQFGIINAPVDLDSAYHAAVGRLIRQNGILQAFPWTPFSWLSDHYADKELLIHLFFVPFSSLDWILSVKIVGTLIDSVLLITMYVILRSENVRFAGLWAIFPLVLSSVFLFRFALVRPFIISTTLALVVLWAAVNDRPRIVALVSVIYPWAYVAWLLPVVLVVISEIAGVLSGRKLRWGAFIAVCIGTTVGVALHPNAMNLLRLAWIEIGEVLMKVTWGHKTGFELGEELRAFTIDEWVHFFIPSVLMFLAALVMAWRNRRNDRTSFAFALGALFFFALTIKSAKFTEYFIPFTVMAFAFSARSLSWRYLTSVVFGVTLIFTSVQLYEQTKVLGSFMNFMPPETETILQKLIPPGSQVFTDDWRANGLLLMALPNRKFIVALEPTFAYMKDAELYRLWYGIPREAPSNAAELIRQKFRARFVLSFLYKSKNYDFYNKLATDPTVKWWMPVGDYWLLFYLGEPVRTQKELP